MSQFSIRYFNTLNYCLLYNFKIGTLIFLISTSIFGQDITGKYCSNKEKTQEQTSITCFIFNSDNTFEEHHIYDIVAISKGIFEIKNNLLTLYYEDKNIKPVTYKIIKHNNLFLKIKDLLLKKKYIYYKKE